MEWRLEIRPPSMLRHWWSLTPREPVCVCVCVCVVLTKSVPTLCRQTHTSKPVPLVGDGVPIVAASDSWGASRRSTSPTLNLIGRVRDNLTWDAVNVN